MSWNQRYPPKEFWERYDRGEFGNPRAVAWEAPEFQAWTKEVAALAA